ncbi:MAG TPA: OsmC family protein [Actinomycetes bacterium]|nr:OsmC family protein [Actinomycetes bacterium]
MARGGASKEVVARWEGGLKATVTVGLFQFVVDEPETSGGTSAGPMPTEYLLGSLASCYVLALAWSARKRGIELPADLEVTAQGEYDGPSFASLTMRVRSSLDDEQLALLMESANRVCYVSRTLTTTPTLDVQRG